MRLFNLISKEELKERLQQSDEERITLSFYRYANIGNPNFFRNYLYLHFSQAGVFGRIYVAHEGINGQISVLKDRFEDFLAAKDTVTFLQDIRLNFAIEDDGKSFYKLKIKVRPKIVADGLNDDTFDASNRGVHLDAKSFNELTDREETIIVDMRNHYESEVGHFEDAITPDVETFREALPQVEEILEDKKDKPIVMYCTGGIRCEKASAYFKHKGFKDVYQLDGGIIEYARQVENQGLPNKFRGKNFVFDERMGETINGEVISKCHQCGAPCDTHINCANEYCHILFLQCDACATKYEQCCSNKCKDFRKLPEEEQNRLRVTTAFNGTKFGKGRYKALHQHDQLEDTRGYSLG